MIPWVMESSLCAVQAKNVKAGEEAIWASALGVI
jgi:hypothetical protein